MRFQSKLLLTATKNPKMTYVWNQLQDLFKDLPFRYTKPAYLDNGKFSIQEQDAPRGKVLMAVRSERKDALISLEGWGTKYDNLKALLSEAGWKEEPVPGQGAWGTNLWTMRITPDRESVKSIETFNGESADYEDSFDVDGTRVPVRIAVWKGSQGNASVSVYVALDRKETSLHSNPLTYKAIIPMGSPDWPINGSQGVIKSALEPDFEKRIFTVIKSLSTAMRPKVWEAMKSNMEICPDSWVLALRGKPKK